MRKMQGRLRKGQARVLLPELGAESEKTAKEHPFVRAIENTKLKADTLARIADIKATPTGKLPATISALKIATGLISKAIKVRGESEFISHERLLCFNKLLEMAQKEYADRLMRG